MNTTPGRSVRIPDAVWKAAMAAAKRNGETLTDVIIRALKSYARRNQP